MLKRITKKASSKFKIYFQKSQNIYYFCGTLAEKAGSDSKLGLIVQRIE